MQLHNATDLESEVENLFLSKSSHHDGQVNFFLDQYLIDRTSLDVKGMPVTSDW